MAPSDDDFQAQLNDVSRKLALPSFLKDLTPSRLPSQAASDASGSSPKDRDGPAHRRARSFASPLHNTHAGHEPDYLQSFDAESLRLSVSLLLAASNVSEDGYAELCSSEEKARRAWVKMAATAAFSVFDHGHQDLVLAVDFNFFGTRMVTASSDHRVKVWDRRDDAWTLVDSWRAHDAEVVDVKWNGPFMGEVIGTIGEDGYFKLWQEDVTEIANSGRRFKLIYRQVSETKVPFMSLDFKNIMQETWIALVTRDGVLTVLEPVDHGNFSGEWHVIAHKQIIQPPPPPSEERSFRVCFHHEQLPCWTAIQAGLDRRALSFAVVAMDVVKVFRTDKNRRPYIAAELTGARNIIRDVAWANGSMRGTDIIATASKDGMIRIYELSTPEPSHAPSTLAAPAVQETQPSPRNRARNAPSGIGAGLAGASRIGDAVDHDQDPGRVKHAVKMVAELASNHGAVWRVSWSQMGDLLVSTGDDGAIRTWKKASDNRWLEYAEIEPYKGQ
ncbi:WD40-repeat-containing domain protein [Phyllosticta capitalensis]